MQFNGFEVTPVGDARVSIIQNSLLRVSNMGSSGLDGVQIYASGKERYKISARRPQNIANPNSYLKHTTMFKDYLELPFTVCEQYEWYDSSVDKVLLGYNLGFFPDKFNLVGYLDGIKVFDIEVDKDNPPPPVPGIWIIPLIIKIIEVLGGIAGIVALGLYLYDRQPPAETTSETLPQYEMDLNGNVTRTGIHTYTDPDPFEVHVNNNVYTVDKVGIEFGKNIVPPIAPNDQIYLPKAHSTIITSANIDEFIITSIDEIILPTSHNGK